MSAPDLSQTHVTETCGACEGTGVVQERHGVCVLHIWCGDCDGHGRRTRHAYAQESGEQPEEERQP